jgi:hypothetical protein
MFNQPFSRKIQALFTEKKLPCSPGAVQFIRQISWNLKEQGISPDPQIIDFIIDVLRAMAFLNISSDDSLEEIADRKEEIMEWLEVFGWRRSWFMRPLRNDWAA